jgi:hypothetical protein
MYIEFAWSKDGGGQTAAHAVGTVSKKLAIWANKYNVEYKTKIIKCKLRVTFDLDEYYTLFGLTWVLDPKYPSWTNYRLISDLNNKI